jgi:hypothetical protein
MLDGSSLSVPDLGGKFIAACGEVPVNGTPLPVRDVRTMTQIKLLGWAQPGAGYLDESLISNVDLSNAAYRIQYIPQEETPQEDNTGKPVTPTDLFATAGIGKITLTTTRFILVPEKGDVYEYYASITNNRPDSVLVGSGNFDTLSYTLAPNATRYFWVRIRRPQDGVDSFSDFYPSSATAGVEGTALTSDTPDIEPGAATDVYSAADTGPIDIVLTPPSTQIANQHVKYVTAVLDVDATVEVSCNWRTGVTYSGSGLDVYMALAQSFSSSGAIISTTERIQKTGNVYEPFAAVATFVCTAGSYRFGLINTIQLGDGVNTATATHRDINLRATVIKR